jgi:MinD-like ATPase involved in chromosome partitioning or flagellar assembly
MAGGRFVVLGLAAARSAWFREVAHWSNASSVPVEFIKCVSAEEVRARLATGRPFSALLIDSSVPSLDRDLIEVAQQAGCAVIVVEDRGGERQWTAIGANGALPALFDRKDLVDTLTAHATMIGRTDGALRDALTDDAVELAPLAAVCGPGGTGTSTVAAALAQGWATRADRDGPVLLADLALHAQQAMLHDARDVVPGVQELVEAFRTGRPSIDDIRQMTFAVEERCYALLLGLRQSRAWGTIRPRAFGAALEGMRQAFGAVVADVDADIEGEDEGGSIDVEERHTMARTAIGHADAVFVVGVPALKGVHSMVRVMTELLEFGVPTDRLVPVVNHAPRSTRARTTLAETLAGLMPQWARTTAAQFLPVRRVDEAFRDGAPLPDALTRPLATAFANVLEQTADDARRPTHPSRVTPGSIGHWPEAALG